jgi:hypothetical protein
MTESMNRMTGIRMKDCSIYTDCLSIYLSIYLTETSRFRAMFWPVMMAAIVILDKVATVL